MGGRSRYTGRTGYPAGLLVMGMVILLVGVGIVAAAEPGPEVVSTFSIVACDPDREEWGIGVASRFLAVGSVVPWARADAGAIATQSYANTTYGPRGLELLRRKASAEDVLEQLLNEDEDRERRQVGIVDLKGNIANFTGEKCHPWAGARAGRNYSCQGNILAGPEVVEAMATAFEQAPGPLAWRIMAALEAGQERGGDVRGKQAAAILIVRTGAGYGGFNDRMVDLRVDDHEHPIRELSRILAIKVQRPED